MKKEFLQDIQITAQKTSIVNLKPTDKLYQKLWELASPSYEDPTAVLNRDIQQCDTLYLAKDQNSELLSFFMVGWGKISVNNIDLTAIFLGLGATSSSTKNTGIIRNLFEALISDARQWEIKNKQKLILWHTTISPFIFHAFNLMFSDNEPRNDGSYSAAGKEIALAIRKGKGWPVDLQSHPFILKNVAKNTFYSKSENERIKKICLEKNFTLFKDLGISERNGDRLLRISYTPDIIAF